MPVTQDQAPIPIAPENPRTLYITGAVDNEMAHRTIVALEQMDRTDGEIRIVLNSEGGNEQDGYAIHDAITMCRNRVVIDGYGSVMSIAAAIFQAGDWRRMAPNADFMIHNGSIGMVDTTMPQDQVVAVAADLVRGSERYNNILANGSQQDPDTIAAWCKDETTFNAVEARDVGFADEIIEPKKTRIPKKTRKRSKRA
jgi:ATP-dependent Clp protease protease subunit